MGDAVAAGDLGPGAGRTSVGSIPVFWAEAPPPFTAMLAFRVGRADETLVTAGITHLVEHLAMPPHDLHPFDLNATVEAAWTTFYASGTEEEVLGFLGETAARLAELPLERLEAERRILRAEASGTAESAFTTLLGARFGAEAWGLLAQGELGLLHLGPEPVAAWSRERFTAGNAAVWMTGPPPDGLELPLPAGPRIPPPEPRQVEPVSVPGRIHWGSGGIAVSCLAPRSAAVACAFRIARARAHALLRFELGVSYGVGGEYLPFTAEQAYAFLVADALEGHVAEARDGLLRVLGELAAAGPTAEELERDVALVRRRLADPLELAAWLDACARNELLGAPVLGKAEYLAELEAVTPRSAAEAIARAMETALFLVPDDVGMPDDRFPLPPEWDDPPVAGRRFRPPGLVPWRRARRTVVLADDGLSLRDEFGAATVRFRDCAGVLAYEDGVRLLVRRDGRWLTVAPEGWAGGAELVRLLDAKLPRELVVPAGEPYSQP